MYKIGIVGHSPEHFRQDFVEVRRAIGSIIDLLAFQYGEDVVFNIIGDIGVGLWAALHCLQKEYKYCLFLPYSLEDTSKDWYEDQIVDFKTCYDNAHAISISYPDRRWKDKSYETLIDSSNFAVCFWIGKKQGKTFDAIKYALAQCRPLLHGLDNLRLIANSDIKDKHAGSRRKK